MQSYTKVINLLKKAHKEVAHEGNKPLIKNLQKILEGFEAMPIRMNTEQRSYIVQQLTRLSEMEYSYKRDPNIADKLLQAGFTL